MRHFDQTIVGSRTPLLLVPVWVHERCVDHTAVTLANDVRTPKPPRGGTAMIGLHVEEASTIFPSKDLDALTMLDDGRGKRSVDGWPRAKQAISVIGTTELCLHPIHC